MCNLSASSHALRVKYDSEDRYGPFESSPIQSQDNDGHAVCFNTYGKAIAPGYVEPLHGRSKVDFVSCSISNYFVLVYRENIRYRLRMIVMVLWRV